MCRKMLAFIFIVIVIPIVIVIIVIIVIIIVIAIVKFSKPHQPQKHLTPTIWRAYATA